MKRKAPSEHEDGLLEYLEDIIGTSKYKTPVDEALVELDTLAEQGGEKLNRLRIIEREKNTLEDKNRGGGGLPAFAERVREGAEQVLPMVSLQCFEVEENCSKEIVSSV